MRQNSTWRFVETQKAVAFGKVINILKEHITTVYQKDAFSAQVSGDNFLSYEQKKKKLVPDQNEQISPGASLIEKWTPKLIQILSMGEDACQAFIDKFVKLSAITDETITHVNLALTVLFKAFGRKLHYLLKKVKPPLQNEYNTTNTTGFLSPMQSEYPKPVKNKYASLNSSVITSQSVVQAQVPYKTKLRFKELLINVNINELLLILVNCDEGLELQFYFNFLLYAMLLEESSIQQFQGAWQPILQTIKTKNHRKQEQVTKIYRPIDLHVFDSLIIQAKTFILKDFPKSKHWYRRVLQPISEFVSPYDFSRQTTLTARQNDEIPQNLIDEEQIQDEEQVAILKRLTKKWVQTVNDTQICIADLAIESYAELMCAQSVIVNSRKIKYLEHQSALNFIILAILPILMHKIKVRSQYKGCFRLVTDSKGSIDIDRTKQYYSIGVRGIAGQWWVSKVFENRTKFERRNSYLNQITMSDYIEMIDNQGVDLVNNGLKDLYKVENYRGKTSVFLKKEAEQTYSKLEIFKQISHLDFRLQKLLQKEIQAYKNNK